MFQFLCQLPKAPLKFSPTEILLACPRQREPGLLSQNFQIWRDLGSWKLSLSSGLVRTAQTVASKPPSLIGLVPRRGPYSGEVFWSLDVNRHLGTKNGHTSQALMDHGSDPDRHNFLSWEGIVRTGASSAREVSRLHIEYAHVQAHFLHHIRSPPVLFVLPPPPASHAKLDTPGLKDCHCHCHCQCHLQLAQQSQDHAKRKDSTRPTPPRARRKMDVP